MQEQVLGLVTALVLAILPFVLQAAEPQSVEPGTDDPAIARTFHIDASAGSDANDGLTPSTPKGTIQAVIDAYLGVSHEYK